MKKTTAAILALSILVICIFAGCNGAEGGKITEKSTTDKMTTANNFSTEEDTRNGVEQLITDAQTKIEEFGSNAESRAEEMKTDAESAVSGLFSETVSGNVNS